MKYDCIVIGAGSGGLNIAVFMTKVGFKTLLIDKSDKSIGGDCLNTGCVPSKAIIHLASLAYHAKQAQFIGLDVTGSVDLKKVMDYVRSKQDVIREHENAAWFEKMGMDVELGEAKFVDKQTVNVNGKHFSGKKIIIATGSRPRKLVIPGVEKVSYRTNENIFDMTKLPKKLVVVGGGPIGIELGQVFGRLGSEVHILEKGDQFLPKENPHIAKVLYEQLVKEGVTVHYNTSPVRFIDSNTLEVQKGKKKETIDFDEILISIGRVLNSDHLDLEKAEIETYGGKIKVDPYLRTTNQNVLVCGDVAGSYQFTHAAELHAGVILSNFFSPFKKKLSNDHLSWVTYTYPEIATFGLNEVQLKQRKIPHETLELDFTEDDRSIVEDFTSGKMVLYLSKKKTLLGGSMVAPHAGELFQELVLANSAGLNVKTFFNKIYPYPTASRVNKRIIQQYFAKKLTPFSKKVLRWLF